jgi:hypothetical protein
MKKPTIQKHLAALVKITDEAIQKAVKRGDLGLLARLIREQRHNLKALRK